MRELRLQTKEFENGWQFEVEVVNENSKTIHQVILNRDFYQRIAQGKITPQELVKKSFEFLLEREPAESILPKFNVELISNYFPEYEEEIIKKIN